MASWYSSSPVEFGSASCLRSTSRALAISGETAVARLSTVSSPAGALSCGKNPSVAVFSRTTRPASGDDSPRMSEKSVDLPAPFGPTNPMRSPRFTCNEASSKSVRPANDLETRDNVSITKGGDFRGDHPGAQVEVPAEIFALSMALNRAAIVPTGDLHWTV